MPGAAPTELARFLAARGYHPRSSSHGEAMCDFLLRDLHSSCPAFKAMVDSGSIVYQTNYTVNKNTPSEWTIDLVVGKSGGPLLGGFPCGRLAWYTFRTAGIPPSFSRIRLRRIDL